MKTIIGISGKAQHGKDTVANILQEKYSGEILHFADLLKEQAKILGWDGEKDLGGREFLQVLSKPIKDYGNWLSTKYSEYADFANDNYYTASLFNKIKESNSKIFYIADMRFVQEYFFLKNKCQNNNDIRFISIRVNRTNDQEEFDNRLSDKQKLDRSETELDGYVLDYTIPNCSDLDYLQKWISKNIRLEN